MAGGSRITPQVQGFGTNLFATPAPGETTDAQQKEAVFGPWREFNTAMGRTVPRYVNRARASARAFRDVVK